MLLLVNLHKKIKYGAGARKISDLTSSAFMYLPFATSYGVKGLYGRFRPGLYVTFAICQSYQSFLQKVHLRIQHFSEHHLVLLDFAHCFW
jgi:hypothetical protein